MPVPDAMALVTLDGGPEAAAGALRGLAEAHAQSLVAHASEQAAVRFRAYVVVPYLPAARVARAGRCAAALARSVATTMRRMRSSRASRPARASRPPRSPA